MYISRLLPDSCRTCIYFVRRIQIELVFSLSGLPTLSQYVLSNISILKGRGDFSKHTHKISQPNFPDWLVGNRIGFSGLNKCCSWFGEAAYAEGAPIAETKEAPKKACGRWRWRWRVVVLLPSKIRSTLDSWTMIPNREGDAITADSIDSLDPFNDDLIHIYLISYNVFTTFSECYPSIPCSIFFLWTLPSPTIFVLMLLLFYKRTFDAPSLPHVCIQHPPKNLQHEYI